MQATFRLHDHGRADEETEQLAVCDSRLRLVDRGAGPFL